MEHWAQLLTAVGFLLNAGAAVFGAYQSYKGRKQSDVNGVTIDQVHLATNSMKDALVKATGEAALAKGTAAGLEQGRAEHR